MVLEVSFCGYLALLLFNPNMRQKPMLESQWWSQESRRMRERKSGLRGGRQTERRRERDTGIDRSFKDSLPTMLP